MGVSNFGQCSTVGQFDQFGNGHIVSTGKIFGHDSHLPTLADGIGDLILLK